MSLDGLMPIPPEGYGGEQPGTSIEDPRRRHSRSERWERRTAQWRTLELAEAVFGSGETRVELASYPARNGFHGLLHISVPFEDLETHRRREAEFTERACQDEVLAELPMIFVFDPVGSADR